MLTQLFSVSVASFLQEIPGATSSHSGLAGSCNGGKTCSLPVSSAIRCASGPHREADGRSTSVGQETKDGSVDILVVVGVPQAVEVISQAEQQGLADLRTQAATRSAGGEFALDHRKDRFDLRALSIALLRKLLVHLSTENARRSKRSFRWSSANSPPALRVAA